MAEATVRGGSSFGVTMRATLSIRVNHAVPYLIGAARYSRLVKKIEAANANSALGDFWDEMRDHAVSCIFFADAALESYANELFADAPKVFPVEFVPGLELLWGELEKRKSSFDKLELALSLRNKPKFNRKLPLLKGLEALGRLRNELTHFKPEWSHKLKKHHAISSSIQGHFQPSGWFPGEPIFPRAWVSHSCTEWAVNTSIDFLKEFENAADLVGRTDWAAFQTRLTP